MHRAFGATLNGSLPAYGAVGELRSQLGNINHVSMRGLGAGSKPKLQPTLKGEIIDKVEFASKFGWAAVYVIARNKKPSGGGAGYTTSYAVQFVSPGSGGVNTVHEGSDLAVAKQEAIKAQEHYRNSGSTPSGLSGLGGLGGPLDLLSSPTFFPIASAIVLYIGADMPLARPVLKKTGEILGEPKQAVQNGMLIIGLLGLSAYIIKEGGQ